MLHFADEPAIPRLASDLTDDTYDPPLQPAPNMSQPLPTSSSLSDPSGVGDREHRLKTSNVQEAGEQVHARPRRKGGPPVQSE